MSFRPPAALAEADRRPWTDAPRTANDGPRFVILADRTGGAKPGVFERAIAQTNLLAPDFVISIGDLIEGYSRDEATLLAQWAHIDAATAALDAPLFVIPGNHDMSSPHMQQLWRDRYGVDYYHFVLGDTLFLCLSTDDPPRALTDELLHMIDDMKARAATDPDGVRAEVHAMVLDDALGPSSTISDAQVDYFCRVLDAHPDPRWTVVFAHKPCWAHAFAPWERLEARLHAHSGDRYTVFAGHQHMYKHEVRNGADYIRLGVTGGQPLMDGDGALEHVTLVTMTDGAPRIANLTLDGILDLHGRLP